MVRCYACVTKIYRHVSIIYHGLHQGATECHNLKDVTQYQIKVCLLMKTEN